MKVAFPDIRLLRFVVLILLGVIALQAIPTKPLPYHLEDGSAFSASTAQVSLSARETQVRQEKIVPLDRDIPAGVFPAAPIEAVAAFSWRGISATGPPARWPRSPSATPRGPPLLS